MTTPFLKRGIWRSQWSTLPAGTAAAPALTFTGDTDTGLFAPAADTLALTTGGTERLRVDSAGNVGVGVTPSAWNSSHRALQGIGSYGAFSSDDGSGAAHLTSNAFFNASNAWVYNNSAAAARYEINGYGGVHRWFIAASGTAGDSVSFSQAMTLNAAGALLVGTANENSNARAHFYGTTASNNGLNITHAGVGSALVRISAENALTFGIDGANGNTERARVTADGNLGLGAATFGTDAAKVLAIANGTEPSTGPADTIQIYSVDRSAGNTIPAIYCEGSGVTNAGITSTTVTHKIAIKVNGTVYYLLATTDAT
jgi:hypothetical protein